MLDFPLRALVSQTMPNVWLLTALKRGGRKPVRSQDLGCCNMIEIGTLPVCKEKKSKVCVAKMLYISRIYGLFDIIL